MANDNPNAPDGTIPVPDAMDMASNWKTYLDESGSEFNARSYLIPIISIQNLLKYNPDAEAIRAYIGLGDTEDITTTKLLMVPIVDGKEVIYKQVPPENGYGGCDSDDCSNIYDLNEPCPPYCGPGDPGEVTLG
jgi:hypothetical protein